MNLSETKQIEMTLPLPVEVRIAQQNDQADWSQYVDSHPEGSVWHSWRWGAVLERSFGHKPFFLIARREGKVCGILPLALVKSPLFGSSIVSLPFCHYAGPLVDDPVARAAFDQFAKNLAKAKGVGHLEYRGRAAPSGEWPSTDLYVVFRKQLTLDHEENLLSIPRKQRAMVRKGIKNELSVSISRDHDLFFDLYSDNVHRHGSPTYGKKYFKILLEEFGEDVDILVVKDKHGTPVSAVLSLYHANEAFPFYAGDRYVARDLAANDFKYWELMKHSVSRGCLKFNFGRSKRGTGSFDFKKNWGFEPMQLAYEYCLITRISVPENNPLNPKYQLAIKLWRKLPRLVVNRIGPMIVKGLG